VKASASEVLTTREAAQMLGVALRTAQLWVESGVLRAWKTAGGHRRIARTSVEALLRERAAAIGPSPAPESRTAEGSDRFTVLLVEDEPALLSSYMQHFDAMGPAADLVTASDGYEALIRIGETRPDLLLCDLSLPGIDGLRLIRHLRSDRAYKSLQIVVVTALGRRDIADRGGLPAGVRVFPRPLPFTDFAQLVKTGVEHRIRRRAAAPR